MKTIPCNFEYLISSCQLRQIGRCARSTWIFQFDCGLATLVTSFPSPITRGREVGYLGRCLKLSLCPFGPSQAGGLPGRLQMTFVTYQMMQMLIAYALGISTYLRASPCCWDYSATSFNCYNNNNEPVDDRLRLPFPVADIHSLRLHLLSGHQYTS